jgi:Flp pilus assembly protein TadG
MNRAASGGRQRLRRRFPKGIALVWASVMILVMLLMVGLGIDMGKLAYNVHQLQNAADAAALAGAQVVRSDPGRARDLALQLALANRAEGLPVEIDRNDDNDEAAISFWGIGTRARRSSPRRRAITTRSRWWPAGPTPPTVRWR